MRLTALASRPKAQLSASGMRTRTKTESCTHKIRKCVGYYPDAGQDVREGKLPCGVRAKSWPSSLHKVLGDKGDVTQKFRRGFQVPVGSVDVDVTQVGGQGYHVLPDSLTASRRGLQCPNGERVAKLMNTWPSTAERLDSR